MLFLDECYAMGRKPQDNNRALQFLDDAYCKHGEIRAVWYALTDYALPPKAVSEKSQLLFSYVDNLLLEWWRLRGDDRLARAGELWRRCSLFARDADEGGGKEFTDWLALEATVVYGVYMEDLVKLYLNHDAHIFSAYGQTLINALDNQELATDQIAAILEEVEPMYPLGRFMFNFSLDYLKVDEDHALRLERERNTRVTIQAPTVALAWLALSHRVGWDDCYLQQIFEIDIK